MLIVGTEIFVYMFLGDERMRILSLMIPLYQHLIIVISHAFMITKPEENFALRLTIYLSVDCDGLIRSERT